MFPSSISTPRREKYAEWLVTAAALLIAWFAARPYAGSWNDGSRLATVESLVDAGTWSIEDSTFVLPADPLWGTPLPYPASERGLLEHGTLDKLYVDGHYYSDKSPVPALWMAACYRLWQAATGATARTQTDCFCLFVTRTSSGLAYVLAVWCLYRLGRRLRLSLRMRLALTGSFAVATVALPYCQHVNNHVLLLAVSSALALTVAGLREDVANGRASWRRFAGLGALAGLGYVIDLGAGPVILLCTAVLVLLVCWSRQRRFRENGMPFVAFALSALPWLVLHHALNYAIGGTFKPANANPEYFRWPGSPFASGNLTGSWIHPNVGSFLLYAASMFAGKRGFLGHNLPLFLTIPTVFVLLRRHRELWRETLWALGCCAGTWLLYAATSNNSSGQCCTIRWFVPLLAPAYLVLGLLLQRQPRCGVDFLLLTGWGMMLVALMHEGPWLSHAVRFFWPIQALALVSWWLSYPARRYLAQTKSDQLLRMAARSGSRRRSLVPATQHPYTKVLGNISPSEERPSSYG